MTDQYVVGDVRKLQNAVRTLIQERSQITSGLWEWRGDSLTEL